jgi:small subunit ribosomal protein S8e
MAISQKRSRRKPTGGRYKSVYKEKFSELGTNPTLTKLEARRTKKLRIAGANKKMRLLATDTANVLDPKTKKYSKAKITNVSKNSANRNYIRRNILTKGAIIETDKGKARITSRPGQVGTVNAILISE